MFAKSAQFHTLIFAHPSASPLVVHAITLCTKGKFGTVDASPHGLGVVPGDNAIATVPVFHFQGIGDGIPSGALQVMLHEPVSKLGESLKDMRPNSGSNVPCDFPLGKGRCESSWGFWRKSGRLDPLAIPESKSFALVRVPDPFLPVERWLLTVGWKGDFLPGSNLPSLWHPPRVIQN